MLNEHKELRMEIEEIKNKLNNQDKNLELVFSYLDELVDKKESKTARKRVGFMPYELYKQRLNVL